MRKLTTKSERRGAITRPEGPVLDRCQGGDLDKWTREIAGRGLGHTGERYAGKAGQRKRCGCWKDGMRAGAVIVIAACAAIDLCGVLRRQQVVGHGDGRKQDQNDHRQGHHLDAAIRGSARRRTHPRAQNPHRHQRPTEIESQLHPRTNSTLGMNVNGKSLYLSGWTETHRLRVEIPWRIHEP